MKLPSEIAVMTLPEATLFPQALLPLYIFEPRYRQMLADALHSNRMFSVAMQKPGSSRETPSPVAGLGLIRVSVGHRDGTSHLIPGSKNPTASIAALQQRQSGRARGEDA
jgi:Lon protease-like protein